MTFGAMLSFLGRTDLRHVEIVAALMAVVTLGGACANCIDCNRPPPAFAYVRAVITDTAGSPLLGFQVSVRGQSGGQPVNADSTGVAIASVLMLGISTDSVQVVADGPALYGPPDTIQTIVTVWDTITVRFMF